MDIDNVSIQYYILDDIIRAIEHLMYSYLTRRAKRCAENKDGEICRYVNYVICDLCVRNKTYCFVCLTM